MEGDNLALEILVELKHNIKRLYTIIIILIVLLFVTNIAWLYAWNLPADNTSNSYDIQSEDNGNAVYNQNGEVGINGKSNSDTDTSNKR